MKKYYALPCMALLGVLVLIITSPANARQGALDGFDMATKIIIPSLLPVLIITNSIVCSKCADVIDTIMYPITNFIFRLPRQTGSVILLGLIGGYPTGAMLTAALLDSGEIDKATARRLLRFNFSGGVAFIITAVGSVRLESTRAGVLLLLSVVMSCVIIGAVQGIIAGAPPSCSAGASRCGISEGILKSVEASTKSILLMSSWIISFSTLCRIIKIPHAVIPLIEITNGIFSGDGISLGRLAFFLAFGGVCVHFQIFDIIKRADMKYYDFMLHRLLAGAIAYLPIKAYSLLCPEEISVFSNTAIKAGGFVQYNSMLSIVLLVGCVVLVFDVKNRKSKLI